jgi:hypothetical protein
MIRPLALGALAGCFATLGVACTSSSPKTAADAGTDAHVGQRPDAHAETSTDARKDRGVVDAGVDAPGFVPLDSGNPVVIDDANCVAPGTASNANGVGGYCSPNGGQCAIGSLDAGAVCTADFNVPAHAWFCTVACSSTSECGPGSASCLPSIHGEACIPAACVVRLDAADGGADTRPDVASDASISPDAG